MKDRIFLLISRIDEEIEKGNDYWEPLKIHLSSVDEGLPFPASRQGVFPGAKSTSFVDSNVRRRRVFAFPEASLGRPGAVHPRAA